MKKIFVLTGESSGDKLASKAISDLKKINPNIEYLSVGGENLKRISINSIYDLKEITYLGFTSVYLNIFKIKDFKRSYLCFNDIFSIISFNSNYSINAEREERSYSRF